MDATAADLVAELQSHADPGRAAVSMRFFKTGPGEYGEGDVFLGLSVPTSRAIAKRYSALSASELRILLDSPVHEHRLAALLVMIVQAKRRPAETAELYLDAVERGRVNNWDLVDASAEGALGTWLVDRPRDVLDDLAASDDLWKRRVAIISTFAFLHRGDASTTLRLAERLLDDRRDLIQKAVGWMLREVGKRVDRDQMLGFLDANAPRMGRTALSYAIEHLDPELRAHYRTLR